MPFYYRNPYDENGDRKNWMRWNIGEEDGSRGMEPRGKSTAYKDGYNAGKYLFVLLNSKPFETAKPKTASRGHSH